MSQKINISIPKPCHENWQTMNPTEKGRFCASCQKDIFDFTKATDKQIIEAYSKNKNLCGRFLNTQLNRDLFKPKERKSIWLATTTVIFSFLVLGNQEVKAQEKAKTEQTDKKVISENSNCDTSNQEKEITGIVTDAVGPMPGVNVVVKGTQRGTQTDFDGKFNIKTQEGEILVFSYLGMRDVTRTIDASGVINVKMQDDAKMLGEFVTTGGFKRKSFFRRTFSKIKYWFR